MVMERRDSWTKYSYEDLEGSIMTVLYLRYQRLNFFVVCKLASETVEFTSCTLF